MNPAAFAIGLQSHSWAKRKGHYICKACGVDLDTDQGKARETCPNVTLSPAQQHAQAAARAIASAR